jgi:predicted ArsR family transcriptional regulator
MQTTRKEILDYVRHHGEATAPEMAQTLHITPTAVRQHLTILEREGLISVQGTRGRVGRPALVYALTEAGAALFPSRYDELSNLLLDEIRSIAGSKGLQSVLMRAAVHSAEAYESQLKGKKLRERVKEASRIINERGSVADSRANGPDEFLISQYTCPYPNVASAHSAVCAMEVEFVRRLTGGDARLVSSLLRGDKACTYRVRAAQG